MMDLKSLFKSTALSLALAGMGISSSALAVDATLRIHGTIKASPCEVVADDASGNYNVDLGDDIKAGSLAAGTGSEWKTLNLKLKDCPSFATTVTAKFSGMPATEAGAADLFKNDGDADNVQIELLNRTAGTRLGDASTMTVPTVGLINSAVFPLQVRVYSVNGGATPGSISGAVQVEFTHN